MERELWPPLYRALRHVANAFSQKYVQHQPWVLLAVFLWAALHDRPVCWACHSRHWSTTTLRPARLPSAATLSRRIDSVACGLLWRALEQYLRDCGQHGLLSFMDGKPLPIGGNSKDRQARFGRGAGCMAKGYKVHAVWAGQPLPDTWEVAAMNTAEKVVGRRLLLQLSHGGYLLADGDYDASYLYDEAAARGYVLVSRPRRGDKPSPAHYQSPHRLHSIELMRQPSLEGQAAYGRSLYAQRETIERAWGNLVTFGGGLAGLPAWVRGLDRVRTWVWAKLLINAVRIIQKHDLRHL
jgi:hypothetical protein